MNTKIDPNPALYRRLSVPKVDLKSVDEAVSKFFDGVQKLREECGIADVTVLVEVPYIAAGDREVAAAASYHLGNQLNKLPMLARAYGAVRERWSQDIGEIIAEAANAERGR